MATSPDVLRQIVAAQERRVDTLEDKVSETRSSVVGVEKAMVAVLTKLEIMDARWTWVMRFVFFAVTGVCGIIGMDIYRLTKELP